VEREGGVPERRNQQWLMRLVAQQSKASNVNRDRRRSMETGDEIADSAIPQPDRCFAAAILLRAGLATGSCDVFPTAMRRLSRISLRPGQMDHPALVNRHEYAEPQAREGEDRPSKERRRHGRA
jgi:hypothetical protein